MALLRAVFFVAVVASLFSTPETRSVRQLKIRAANATDHDPEPEEIIPNNDGDFNYSTDGIDHDDETSEVNATEPFSALVSEEGEEDGGDDSTVEDDEGSIDLWPDVDEVQDDEEAEAGMPREEDSLPKVSPVKLVADAHESAHEVEDEQEDEQEDQSEEAEEGMEKLGENDTRDGDFGVYNVMTGEVEKDAALVQVGRKTKSDDDEDMEEDDSEDESDDDTQEDESDDSQEDESDDAQEDESDDSSDDSTEADDSSEDAQDQVDEENMEDDDAQEDDAQEEDEEAAESDDATADEEDYEQSEDDSMPDALEEGLDEDDEAFVNGEDEDA